MDYNKLTIDQLEAARNAVVQQMEPLRKQLNDIDKYIQRHPDTIFKQFKHLVDHGSLIPERDVCVMEIINRLECVLYETGQVETRKDLIDWTGHTYKFKDGHEYWWRKGWDGHIERFVDCGLNGDEKCPDMEQEIAYRIWYEKDSYDSLDDLIDEYELDDYQVIGYLLWAKEV